MKKVMILFVILTLMAAVMPTSAQAKQSSSTCPAWLTSQIPGTCLTDIVGQVAGRGDPLQAGRHITVVTNWNTSEWLVSVGVEVPVVPKFFGMMDLNQYRLRLVGVFVDQRVIASPPINEGQFFDSLYVFTELVCDQNGSHEPGLSFSLPRQEIVLADGRVYHRIPRSIGLHVINWEEAINSRCSFQ